MSAKKKTAAVVPRLELEQIISLGSGGAWLDCTGQLSLCWKSAQTGRECKANLTKFPEVEQVAEIADVAVERQRSLSMPSSAVPPTPRRSATRKLSRELAKPARKFREILLAAFRSGQLERLIETGLGDLTRHARQLLLTLGRETPEILMRAQDFTGAGVLHCLLLSNTREALALALELLKYYPPLIHQVHVDNGGALCAFMGEGAIHIAAVQQQQDWIVQALDIIYATDPDSLVLPSAHNRVGVLHQTCWGPFFKDAPMAHFGGTALAYCAAFNQTKVLRWVAKNLRDERQWLFREMRPFHDPNGLTVEQAIVHNGALKAYDALSRPPCKFAGLWECATGGGLTPLRLAARMGKDVMFEHILSSKKTRMWQWGPIASYSVPLDEIDTFGRPGRTQVLDFVVDVNAFETTKSMLSDTVLNGLLWQIIQHKWQRWGRTFFWGWYMWPKVVYALLLTALAAPSVLRPPAPFHTAGGGADMRHITIAVLAFAAYLLAHELFEAVLCLRNLRRHRSDEYATWPHRVSAYVGALNDRYGWLSYLTSVLSLVACAVLLGAADVRTAREEESVSVLLALGVLCSWAIVAVEILSWKQDIGIFNVIVGTMLTSDVIRFMVLYVPLLFGFAAAFTSLFPSSDSRAGSIYSTIENLIVLSLIGEPPETSGTIYPTVLMADLQSGRPLNALCYYALYLAFLILVLVLLLNLLIAMMGRTYQAVLEDSTKQWRLKFARHVLRLELLAAHLPRPPRSSLSKALSHPGHWPRWLSLGFDAKTAQTKYIFDDKAAAHAKDPAPGVGHFYVFRTYDDVADQALVMQDAQRGDPFKQAEGRAAKVTRRVSDAVAELLATDPDAATNALEALAHKDGGGSGGGGAESALQAQMEGIHAALAELNARLTDGGGGGGSGGGGSSGRSAIPASPSTIALSEFAHAARRAAPLIPPPAPRGKLLAAVAEHRAKSAAADLLGSPRGNEVRPPSTVLPPIAASGHDQREAPRAAPAVAERVALGPPLYRTKGPLEGKR